MGLQTKDCISKFCESFYFKVAFKLIDSIPSLMLIFNSSQIGHFCKSNFILESQLLILLFTIFKYYCYSNNYTNISREQQTNEENMYIG